MQRSLMSQLSTRLRRRPVPSAVWRWLLVLVALPPLLGSRSAQAHPAVRTTLDQAIMLAGSVPPPVRSGSAHLVAAAPNEAGQPLTLTLVLRRTDEVAFEQYLAGVQDPHAPGYRQFLTQQELAAQFGPSQGAYAAVLLWLLAQGFALTQGSANRLTITVKGTRQQAERAFKVSIGDYRLGARTFYANAEDPILPPGIASDVLAILGLSNLAQPTSPVNQKMKARDNICNGIQHTYFTFPVILLGFVSVALAAVIGGMAAALCFGATLGVDLHRAWFGTGYGGIFGPLALPSRRSSAAQTNHQKIGLAEFDTFHPSDARGWLNMLGVDTTIANRLSQVDVNGGVSSPGAGESEVLLDIDTVMALDPLPAASYVVYDAPPSTSFAALFNAMINDGDTVISNSWSECEDQVSLSEAQAIDSVLATAAASGISVFNGSGDSGSTCLDGSPDTIGVPADSPHATAVGGTSPTLGPGFTYGGETWWNGANQNPPTGQGGFGVSRYFSRPTYQNGVSAATMRSVPDIVFNADPRAGIEICQADAGGCPTNLLYGGTSMAAPEMAAVAALANQVDGSNMGNFNSVAYLLATNNAFHSAASMGSDFAHVGLGSPDFDYLMLALSHQSIGPVSPALSPAAGSGAVAADGATQGTVTVNLVDANGYPVAGKAVTLTANAGSNAVLSAPSGSSSVDGGAVTFSVTDTVPETVTFTVKDTTDNVTLDTQPTIQFVPPPATGGSISATPETVPADGATPSTITVTLLNAKGQGAQGKTVLLSQGAGHAIVTGSGVTGANGIATFQATDLTAETVTFTAVDATDGYLPVPGSAQMQFTTGNGANNCPASTPSAGNGFALATYASGFYDGNLAHLAQCDGPDAITFDAAGNAYVGNIITGDIFKFDPSGGVATGTTRVTQTPLGVWLHGLAFGKNGDLYALRTFTPDPPTNGDAIIYQIDPTTGAMLRTVADNLPWDTVMAVDPISGDLFVGNGFNNVINSNDILRIHDSGSSTPVNCHTRSPNGPDCTVYASPGAVDGLAFDPDGTLYARGAGTTGDNANIWAISGTNSATPGQITLLDSSIPGGGYITVLRPEANGKRAVVAVIKTKGTELDEVDLNQSPIQPVPLVTGSSLQPGVVGPDGCLYTFQANSVFKVTAANGSCPFAPSSGVQPTLRLSPSTIAPNPGTGEPVTFTATLANVSNASGMPILFAVTGTNPQATLVHAGANGQATFTYTGAFTGADQVIASTTITSTTSITPTTLVSNAASVTWATGKDVSFASLNLSPTTGQISLPVTLQVSLTDITAQPPAPIAGALLTLQLGDQSCVATTGSAGIGSCSLILDEVPGSYILAATYAGDDQHTPDTAITSFVVTQFAGATVSVAAGWSLIDLPLNSTTPIHASDVLAGVLHSSGHLAAIYQLSHNQWSPPLIEADSGALRGTDFTLQPGVGYLLYSDQDSRYLQGGFVPPTQPAWTLSRGWNLVGIAAGASGPIQAATVLAGVLGKNGHLAAIYELNHNAWSPPLIQRGGVLVGTDFTLHSGQGYLLYTDVGTSYTPGTAPSVGAERRGGASVIVVPPVRQQPPAPPQIP